MATIIEKPKKSGPDHRSGVATTPVDSPHEPSTPAATTDAGLMGAGARIDPAVEAARPMDDRSKPFAADRRRWENVSWWSIGWLTFAHLVVLAAPFTFTWTGLAVLVVLHWVTGSLGICLGYHRLLTHNGMKTHPWVRYTFATIGTLAGEGSPLDWVADHRKHHAFSDQDGDPHSPHDGGWWSHMFWLAYKTHSGERKAFLQRWVPDLYKDRGMRFLDLMFLPLHIATGVLLFAVGYAFGGASFGISLVVWGMFVRLVGVLHTTWMVNSASHMWGYRNYETTDDSRNNWFVALIAYGEGWHNNHHAYPRMAKHGHRWWEFDVTWMAIRCLKACGLVWDVVDYRDAAEKKARAEAAGS